MCIRDRCKNVSFELKKGEILGVTGLLGSGRTELALALFGLEKIESGRIELKGKEVKISSPMAAQKAKIGYVPEDRLTEGLCLQQPIADNITLASLKRLSNSLSIIRKKDIIADANIWKEKFAIKTDDVRKFASTLSGGNQQKIVLSKWLSNDLDVLILNGPTVGVDVGAKQDIHHLVHELANEGLAVIMISDEMCIRDRKEYREGADPAYPELQADTYHDVFKALGITGQKLRIGVASYLDCLLYTSHP